jgi:hypothetical protein
VNRPISCAAAGKRIPDSWRRLAVSFLSQLVEVPDVRDAVQRLIGTIRPPQVVLRIGYGSPIVRTPRRAVADLPLGPDDASRR